MYRSRPWPKRRFKGGRWYNNNNKNNNNNKIMPMLGSSRTNVSCKIRSAAFKVLGLFWVIVGLVLFEFYISRVVVLPPSMSSTTTTKSHSLTLMRMDLHHHHHHHPPTSSSSSSSFSTSSSLRKTRAAAATKENTKKGMVVRTTTTITQTRTKPRAAATQPQHEEEEEVTTTNNNNNNNHKACRCVRCNVDKECGHLWVGGVVPSQGNPYVFTKIRLVVSHCLHDLDWMQDFIQGFESAIVELVIYSKCGQEVRGIPRSLLLSSSPSSKAPTKTKISIVRLPNVGRCDHGHAHYLARYNTDNKKNDEEDATDDPSSSSSSSTKREVVVFLKDEREEQTMHQPGRWRSLYEMLEIASTDTGFGCGMELLQARDLHARPDDPFYLVSAYHTTSTLARFSMQQDYKSQSGQGAQGIEKYVGLMEDQQQQQQQQSSSSPPPFMSNFNNLGDFVSSLPGVTATIFPPHHSSSSSSSLSSSSSRKVASLTQVCYGGTFAVTKYQIHHQTSPVTFAALEQRLSRGDNIEESHFTERYWAALLAKPLPQYQIDALLAFSTSTAEWQDYIYGTLTRPIPIPSQPKTKSKQQPQKKCTCVRCSKDQECGGLWQAGVVVPGPGNPHAFDRIRLVVTHCVHNLTWMQDFIQGYESLIQEIVIYSKCNMPVVGIPRLLDKNNATIPMVQRLPNVGRCDHGHAYYLSRYNNKKEEEDEDEDNGNREVVVFLKDERDKMTAHQPGRWRSLEEMLQIASTDWGFGCGMELFQAAENELLSAYHDTKTLGRFSMKEYKSEIGRTGLEKYTGLVVTESQQQQQEEQQPFKSAFSKMLGWVRSIPGAKFPPGGLTQVCYGGTFAVTQSRIQRVPIATWQALETSLARGNNIEEGHFMERLWAALLSKPLLKHQVAAVKEYTTDMATWEGSLWGTLIHRDEVEVEEEEEE